MEDKKLTDQEFKDKKIDAIIEQAYNKTPENSMVGLQFWDNKIWLDVEALIQFFKVIQKKPTLSAGEKQAMAKVIKELLNFQQGGLAQLPLLQSPVQFNVGDLVEYEGGMDDESQAKQPLLIDTPYEVLEVFVLKFGENYKPALRIKGNGANEQLGYVASMFKKIQPDVKPEETKVIQM